MSNAIGLKGTCDRNMHMFYIFDNIVDVLPDQYTCMRLFTAVRCITYHILEKVTILIQYTLIEIIHIMIFFMKRSSNTN